MDISQAKPTIEEIKSWDEGVLLEWLQEHHPKLLKGGNLNKFRAAEITGRAFLLAADNVRFFKNECNLPAGPSLELARLPRELTGGRIISFSPNPSLSSRMFRCTISRFVVSGQVNDSC